MDAVGSPSVHASWPQHDAPHIHAQHDTPAARGGLIEALVRHRMQVRPAEAQADLDAGCAGVAVTLHLATPGGGTALVELELRGPGGAGDFKCGEVEGMQGEYFDPGTLELH